MGVTTDASRAARATQHALPLMLIYQRALAKIEKLRRKHKDDASSFEGERDAVLLRAHGRAAPLLAAMAKDMGCGYLKLAQYFCSQRALVPDAWSEALEFCYERVPRRPFATVEAELKGSLEAGRCSFRDFASIDERPLAAASVAQVHVARLREPYPDADGFYKVAVKVVHGEARALYPADMRTARRLLRMAVAVLKSKMGGTIFSTLDFHDAMAPIELDLRNELRFAEKASELFRERGFRNVVVPRPVKSLSTDAVLTAEFLEGTTLAALGDAAAARLPPDGAAADGDVELTRVGPAPYLPALLGAIDAIGATLFLDGFAHADPHPGNVMVLDDGRVALIDWGFAQELDLADRARLARLILLLATRSRHLVNAAFELDAYSAVAFSDRAAEPDFPAAFLLFVCDTSHAGVDGLTEGVFDRLLYRFRFDPASLPSVEAYPAYAVGLSRIAGSLKRCLAIAGAHDVSLASRWAPYAHRALEEFAGSRGEFAFKGEARNERSLDALLLALPAHPPRWLRRARRLPEAITGPLDRGRLEDPERLLSDAAAVLDARGLVFWGARLLRSRVGRALLAVLDLALRALRL